MLAMALFCFLLMMTMSTTINKEAPRLMELKLRWKLNEERVEFTRLSCTSEWLSVSMLL